MNRSQSVNMLPLNNSFNSASSIHKPTEIKQRVNISKVTCVGLSNKVSKTAGMYNQPTYRLGLWIDFNTSPV